MFVSDNLDKADQKLMESLLKEEIFYDKDKFRTLERRSEDFLAKYNDLETFNRRDEIISKKEELNKLFKKCIGGFHDFKYLSNTGIYLEYDFNHKKENPTFIGLTIVSLSDLKKYFYKKD